MRPHGESKVMESTITRSGEHTTLGLLAEQSLVGCLLGAVGAFKRGNISALSLFSPLVLCVFNPSQICAPGMESCKDARTGRSPVDIGGG